MTPLLSLYLDLIRFTAAMAVLVDHVSMDPFTSNVVWWRLENYGGIAVTIFFLLSGYVIAFVASTRERSMWEYFSSRFARLYSVVTIALLLTFLFDQLGQRLNPDFYRIQTVLWKPESWTGYLSSLFFVNEYGVFGFHGISPGTNGPYWSLSFEATYYVAAGLALFAPKKIAIVGTIVLLLAAGPTISILLPIWVLGYCLYATRNQLRLERHLCVPILVLSALGILAVPRFAEYFPNDNFGLWLPFGRGSFNRAIAQDYAVAILFALHMLAARELSLNYALASGLLQKRIRWLGSLTFPLYCIHFPALCLLAAISPWKNTGVLNLLFLILPTLALVVAVTPVCDWLKLRIHKRLIQFHRAAAPPNKTAVHDS